MHNIMLASKRPDATHVAGFQTWKRLAKLGLVLNVRLRDEQQHNPNDREHPKSSILTVRRFRLPHQEPFASDGQKCDQPHQQTECERDDGKSFGILKRRGRSTQRLDHSEPAPSPILRRSLHSRRA